MSSAQGHSSNAGAATAGEGAHFLAPPRSGNVEITAEDRQEGYELPSAFAERAPAPAAPRPSSEAAEKPLAASSQPYQARTPAPLDSKGRTRLPDDAKGSSGHKKSTRAGGARRRPRKQLKWWQRPKVLLWIGLLIVIIALGAGLGAGLGARNSGDDDKPPSASSSSSPASTMQPAVSRTTTGNGPTVSQSGSADEQTVQVATATAGDLTSSSEPTLGPMGSRAIARWI